MKPNRACLAIWLALTATAACATDVGTVTIAEGTLRVLRGTTWYKLSPGLRLADADIIEAAEKAQVQVELGSGGALNVVGPGMLYAIATPLRGSKPAGPVEFMLTDGWAKIATKAPDAGMRLRSPLAALVALDAIAVVWVKSGTAEVFVETGALRLAESGRDGKEANPRDVRAGEYWAHTSDRPSVIERRPPPAFVAAMPRHMKDPLPAFVSMYKGKTVPLAVEREISYAEAEPWLVGPYRSAFIKRFQRRLSDPAFRSAVNAHISAYPEWDRVLHPEKYVPKDQALTQ